MTGENSPAGVPRRREAQETSGATTRLLLRYVERRAGAAAVAEVVRRSGTDRTREELLDEGRWVSYGTRIRLFEAAADVLGDPRCTFEVGATSLRAGPNPALVLVLRALGSPERVYRQLPRAVPKFSTTATLRAVETGPDHAVLRYELHPGYEPSRLDCLYTQGLLAVVPEIFGLPPAEVVHGECRSDGHPACAYRVTWARRSRWPFRRPSHRRGQDLQVAALQGQLTALQSAAADLVSDDDVPAVLQRITERAAAAVLAPAYLLAVHDPDGGAPLVHSSGLEEDEARRLAAVLLSGGRLCEDAVVVEVASRRRAHGHLAALHLTGRRSLGDERGLLAAYAGHAAAALDLVLALSASRREAARAAALLGLAHELRAAGDAPAVARTVVCGGPRFTGCDASSVLFWDAAAGHLRAEASSGLTAAEEALLGASLIRADDVPELVELLTHHRPLRIETASATPLLRRLLEALDLEGGVVVPLLGGEQLLGVMTAFWRPGRAPADPAEVRARLEGIGGYAATALQNAELLGRVRHQSLHDALTGLPNRVLFGQRLEERLLAAGPGDGTAVLFCDLDGFKQVNDDLGHAAGDELLRQVAARFRAVVRPQDTVARLSGDEFAVLVPGAADDGVAESLGRRVVECFQEPFRVEGRELHVTTSVGVAVHAGGTGRADEVLRSADHAMYAAKGRGRNQVAVAAPGTAPAAAAGPSLEAELRGALERDELRLFFQPVVELLPGGGSRVAGAEALLRWEHPRLGLLPPPAFLGVAEETGLVVELDLWALRTACAERARWPRPQGRELHVAVNLSSRTLQDPRLHAAVRSALDATGTPAGQLHVEVVESRALVDVPAVGERLAELRRLGVAVSLDDFGTGYSTLSWLQRLPVDQVKVDRSFTAALLEPGSPPAVVRGVLALAREVGVDVVAEGVETAEQVEALRAAGCRLVQGYHFGRPVPGPPVVAEPDGAGVAAG